MMNPDSQHDVDSPQSGDRVRFAGLAYLGAGGIAAAFMLAVLLLSPPGEAIRGRIAEPLDRLGALTAVPSQQAGNPSAPIGNGSSNGEVALGPAVVPSPPAASSDALANEPLTANQAAPEAPPEFASAPMVTMPQVEPAREPAPNVASAPLTAPRGGSGRRLPAGPSVPGFLPSVEAARESPGAGIPVTASAPPGPSRGGAATVGERNPSLTPSTEGVQPIAGVMPRIGGRVAGALAGALSGIQTQHAATASVGSAVPGPSYPAVDAAPVAVSQNVSSTPNAAVIAGATRVSANLGVTGQTQRTQPTTTSIGASLRSGSAGNPESTTSVRHGGSTVASAGAIGTIGRAAAATSGGTTASALAPSASASHGRASASASTAVAAAISLPTGAASGSKHATSAASIAAAVTTGSSVPSGPNSNQASLTQLIRGSVGVLPSSVTRATATGAVATTSNGSGPGRGPAGASGPRASR